MQRKVILSFLTFMILSLCLCGCNSGAIPNGKYVSLNPYDSVFVNYSDDENAEYYWEIKGDNANRYVSGMVDYKAKIVEKDGLIYFEGYTFTNVFSKVEMGSTVKYLVAYRETEKTIQIQVITWQNYIKVI